MTPAEAIDRLHELAGKSLLLPKDPAYHPQEEGLAWSHERLSA